MEGRKKMCKEGRSVQDRKIERQEKVILNTQTKQTQILLLNKCKESFNVD